MEESASIITVTPKMAKEWVDKHEEQIANKEILQRSLSEGAVDRYANDMRHGHWIANNQGIGFDENDNLVDGRHRLWAIVRANVPVKMLVVRGMKEFAGNGVVIKPVFTVDGGRPRNLGVYLHLDGIKYATQIAAGLRAMALICTRRDQVRLSMPTAKAMLKMFDRHLMKVIEGLHFDGRLYKGYFLGICAMYRAVEAEKADAFVEAFLTGENLPVGSPVLALKHYIRTHRNFSTDGTVRSCRATALALMHWHNKVKVTTIRNSTLGAEWLTDLAKNQTKRIRAILGDEEEPNDETTTTKGE